MDRLSVSSVGSRNRGKGKRHFTNDLSPSPAVNIYECSPITQVGEVPMYDPQTTLGTEICSMCGCLSKKLDSHHVVPRYMGGEDSDIIQVCPVCHGKADKKLERLLLDPWDMGRGSKWVDKEKRKQFRRRYTDKYIHRKQVYYLSCEDDSSISIMLRYNERVNNISLAHHYHFNSPRVKLLAKEYQKNTRKNHSLFCMAIEPYTYIQTLLTYNTKTGSFNYRFDFHYDEYISAKRREKYTKSKGNR